MEGFNPTVFAKRLQVIRRERGMDQTDLARATGISKNAIARYETGRNLPRIDTACTLADALDCTVDVLIGRNPLIIA